MYEIIATLRNSRDLLSLGVTHKVIGDMAAMVESSHFINGKKKNISEMNALWRLIIEVKKRAYDDQDWTIAHMKLACECYLDCNMLSTKRMAYEGIEYEAINMIRMTTVDDLAHYRDLFESKNIKFDIVQIGR